MEKKIEMAGVSLTLFQNEGPAWKSPIASIARAGRAGLETCAQFVTALGMTFVACAPTLLALALCGYLAWRLLSGCARWRKRRLDSAH
jgi:hypothetical protein